MKNLRTGIVHAAQMIERELVARPGSDSPRASRNTLERMGDMLLAVA